MQHCSYSDAEVAKLGYRFVMANFLVIVVLAMMLGPMGMASDLDQSFDFDEDRLSFESPDNFIEPPERGVTWDGSENDRGENYGYVVYDLTDFQETNVLLVVDSSRFAFRSEVYYLDEETGAELALTTGNNALGTDFEQDEVEIRIRDEDQYFTDIVRGPDFSDIQDQDSIIEEDLDAETSFWNSISNSFRTSLNAISQLPAVIAGWLGFALAIGELGLAGRIVQLYIGMFVAYLLLTEVWIG